MTARNITLLNATYPSVPKINLPISGGGTATFTEITDTTATASDVVSGKYFYTSDGTKTQGTNSGGAFDVYVSWWGLDSVYRLDKTFAEIKTAYNDGKQVVLNPDYPPPYMNLSWGLDSVNDEFHYYVYIYNVNNNSVDAYHYTLDANGLTTDSEIYYFNTTGADAMAEDVLAGKICYNENGFVEGEIPAKTSADLTASGATVTVPSGYYASNATKSVASGTAGTPTATKGTVSNHSVLVTPSVTNTTGYITGSTKTGTAVTVSASELVSGSETKTANGTYDVTNLASLVVNVSGGSSKNAQAVQGTTRTSSSTATAIGAEMTVSKTGTYDVYWSGFRSSTSASYTFGTQLYIDNVAHGTENTTWSNHIQNNHLQNVSLTQGQKIRVRGRNSRGSSYYIYAPTLVIIEV